MRNLTAEWRCSGSASCNGCDHGQPLPTVVRPGRLAIRINAFYIGPVRIFATNLTP
jgi:hypothetical protein